MNNTDTLPLISIIVPVYNVKEYLEKCLDSICSQTYKNLEIIVVDDGSTDGSGEICDSYAQSDTRIKVFHQPNAGQSAARNKALGMAQGELLGFVDSDDWIEKDMYEFLYRLMVESDADISVCSHYVETGTKTKVRHSSGTFTAFSRDEAIRALVVDKRIRNYMWDKLFKRQLFDGISFPENRVFEDIAVSYLIFHKAGLVVMQDSPKYHYLKREGSTTQGKLYNPDKEYQLFLTVYQQVKFVVENGIWDKAPRYVHERGIHLIDHMMMIPPSPSIDAIVKDVLAKMQEYNAVKWPDLTAVSLFKRYLIYHSFATYRIIYRAVRTVFKSKRYKFQIL